jgi:RNA polymerase sigma factor (sigma-70 family)
VFPDLNALRNGKDDAWEQAFEWLWPTVVAVSDATLRAYFPEDVEDIAIEALEIVTKKINVITEVQDLKALSASIAHNLAVSHLRERFTEKRGAGQTRSLEALEANREAMVEQQNDAKPRSPLEELGAAELMHLLQTFQKELKSAEGAAIFNDFFLNQLSYKEIAKKHKVPIGTVGVVLKRGLEALRKLVDNKSSPGRELRDYLR